MVGNLAAAKREMSRDERAALEGVEALRQKLAAEDVSRQAASVAKAKKRAKSQVGPPKAAGEVPLDRKKAEEQAETERKRIVAEAAKAKEVAAKKTAAVEQREQTAAQERRKGEAEVERRAAKKKQEEEARSMELRLQEKRQEESLKQSEDSLRKAQEAEIIKQLVRRHLMHGPLPPRRSCGAFSDQWRGRRKRVGISRSLTRSLPFHPRASSTHLNPNPMRWHFV